MTLIIYFVLISYRISTEAALREFSMTLIIYFVLIGYRISTEAALRRLRSDLLNP